MVTLRKRAPHSEKKGYQNGTPGVLLLQMVPLFQKGQSFFLNNHVCEKKSTISVPLGNYLCMEKIDIIGALLQKGTKLVPQRALFYGPSNGALRAPFWYHLFLSVKVIKRNRENTPHLKGTLTIELNQINTCFTFQQVLCFAIL